MTGYDILTLNTSRIGYNVLTEGNPLLNLLPPDVQDLVADIPDFLTDSVNELVGDTAQALGVDDFYSVHILDYCSGTYEPRPRPNATLSASDIKKNVSDCSDPTAAFHFKPREIIEQKLNESGLDITLEDLNWPDDIERGMDTVHMLQTAVFVLYVISIVLIFLALVAALPALFAEGRLAACCSVIASSLAFLAVGIASGLVTAVIVKGVEVINEHGEQIGLEAKRGNRFLAITWAATALVFLALCWWVVETCVGRRRKRRYAVKHG